MNNLPTLLRAGLFTAFSFLVFSLDAGPVDEARLLFEQDKFDQVETLLKPVLEEESAPVEALELSYRAARASGKVYTAERRIRELIERQGQQDPSWIFEGANVAMDLGQTARAMDRLMFFVSRQPGRTPELKKALELLSTHSLVPEAFATYVERYPEDADFDTGFRMMERIRRNSQPKAFVNMGRLLLENFREEADVDRVHWELYDAVRDDMLGLKRDDAYRAMFTGTIHGFDIIQEMINREGIRHEEMIQLQKVAGRALPHALLRRFEHMDRIKASAVRRNIAREFLRFEPVYRKTGNAEHYRSYLWRIFSEPDAFIPEGGERIVSEEEADAFFRAAVAMHPPEDLHRLRWMGRHVVRDFRDNSNRFIENEARRNALLKDAHSAFRGEELEFLVDSAGDKKRALQALVQLTGGRPDVRRDLLREMEQQGLGDLVASTSTYELMMRPTHFDIRELANAFLATDSIPDDRKVSILQKVHQETGNAKRLRELITHRESRVDNKKGFQDLLSRIDDAREPKDPVLAVLMDIEEDRSLRSGNEPKPAFNEKVRQAFEAYGRPFPSPQVPETRTAYMRRVLDLYRDTADNRREGRRPYARVVTPHLSDRADWEEHRNFVIEGSDHDGWATTLLAKPALEAGRPFHPMYASAWHRDESEETFLEPYYGKMTLDQMKGYLHRNRNQWKPQVLAAQVVAAMKHHDLTRGDQDRMENILGTLREEKEDNSNLSLPLDMLADQVFMVDASGRMISSWDMRREVLRMYNQEGKGREGMAELVDQAGGMDSEWQIVHVLLSALYSDRDTVPGGAMDKELVKGTKLATLLQEILPRMRRISPGDRSRIYISRDAIRSIGWYTGRGDLRESYKQDMFELRTLMIGALARGANSDARWDDYQWGMDDALTQALEQDDVDLVVDLINLAGREADNPDSRGVKHVLDPLLKAERLELVLLTTQLMDTDDPEGRTVLNQARALAGSQVQGIYPVDKTDPEYPLFVAADELAQNNPDQAWTLLRRNLDVFTEDPLQYPMAFTSWALEKLREVKGEEGELQELSMQLSDRVLAREDELTAENRASVMLNRAEIFRDRQDFEAARLEYKTLRTHPELQSTVYGRKAMFRDVDLMISMGNNSAAEGLIEYWLSNPDPELQVKAYYFRALMAFNAGDNEATREHLDKVFELDFTNTEARLLHGKWRLRTNYEVDNPEVLLGTLRDRTILRPGQPLRVTVQDPNLSVVGAGTAIPVIIRTSEGGDEEMLSLFPSTRDPKLFRGSMETALAVAAPGNNLLEVSGQDIVSYEIEPEFLSQRGMTTSDPKRLRIVDDARLAASAGRILSEAEQQAREIEQQMSGVGEATGSDVSHVRPGNPFYIMVRDRDRSIGGALDQVTVNVSTSSGDRLKGVVLEETEPFSGQFRGEVNTALPPPRASASDSAEGIDPGVVINHTRKGVWRSRSDGVQGKWLKADTMGSHEVKRAELISPDASRIAQIRLYGSLQGEEQLLGSFPERAVRGGGITRQTTGTRLRSLVEYRRYFSQTEESPDAQSSFSYDANEIRNRRFHLNGAFWVPEDTRLRLRLLPMNDGHKYPLNDLWMDLLVDGEKIVGGRGRDLMRSPIDVSLQAGGHVLEAFGYARDDSDAWVLGVERPDGSVEPIPDAWFRPEENPGLEEFLQDRATLARSGDRWTATFKEPERLRALRWEFLQYAGDSVTVQELSIDAPGGTPILPTNTDYTDALDNDILEVAPGDQITVDYEDRVTTEGQRRIISRQLSSRFTNGTVAFFFEELNRTDKGVERRLYDAYRFRPGDDFLVVVEDADLDVSEGADTVEVALSTRGGETMTLTARELENPDRQPGAPIHSARFQALLRTSREDETGEGVLRVSDGDRITVTYMDEENTSPGIPVSRSSELGSVQKMDPSVSLYHTWRENVEDTSDEAEMKLEKIRQRTGNENVTPIMTWSTYGMPMSEEMLSKELITVNADTPLPIEVYFPSQAMHQGSALTMQVLTASERRAAESEGREPRAITRKVGLGGGSGGLRLQANPRIETPAAAMSVPEPNATFGTSLRFTSGTLDTVENPEEDFPIPVLGNDRVFVVLFGEGNTPLFQQEFQLASEAVIGLKDSSYEAGRERIHLGERFFVEVADTDRNRSHDMDEVVVSVETSRHGRTTELVLRETTPHSGIFSGVLMPTFPKPEVPAKETSTVQPDGTEPGDPEEDPASELVGIPTLEVAFGESLTFTYQDEQTIPIREPGTASATGSIFEGSDGNLFAFTKYFPDADMAVRVQFRLAESLFEMAKDYRKLNQPDRSSRAIAEGKRILEEALINYPDTALAVEGEYLLANLYQEMAAERADENPGLSREYYREALSRFSSILSGWPDSDFAARAQYHKALCLEKLGDFTRASEEYVKMTYIFPESPLVGEAAIRLATHYYKNEQRYDTAGKIYTNFFNRFPNHPLAPKALFMGAQSHMKQGEVWEKERVDQGMVAKDIKTERILDEYRSAVDSLKQLIDDGSGTVDKGMRAQAMYWAGDASLRALDYQNAYLFLKRTTFEYPETEWARRARGLLLQSAEEFEGLQ